MVFYAFEEIACSSVIKLTAIALDFVGGMELQTFSVYVSTSFNRKL